MDLHNPETWLAAVLAPLPEEKLAAGLRDDDPQWEYIDGELVKLGSLAHSQVDIPNLQRQGLELLATRSKDFRLMAHLLRTLQHAGNHLLATTLLTHYVSSYWATAWPQNLAHKKRLATQVIKRFEAGINSVVEQADGTQRNALSGELAHLAQVWHENNLPELATATDTLSALYKRAFRDITQSTAAPEVITSSGLLAQAVSSLSQAQAVTVAPVVNIDNHDDKAWRATLMNVASILCERQPDSPAGYRLRRHALWQSITSAPQAESDGRTSLAAFSADIMADYQSRANNADVALLKQVEQSLILAPYWFDGHALSAQIAGRLGYSQTANAIRDETNIFLSRLPQLSSMLFSDHSPFISEQTLRWLKQGKDVQPARQLNQPDSSPDVWQRFHEQGLEAALQYLEDLPAGEPRDRFLRQYLGARLMEKAGMVQLAQQHYQMLFKAGLRTTLSEWEPTLLEQLKEKLTAEQ
ncbi:type VI secretion system protein TssA [Enterobacter bugandensis]|uniref:type VI secretion system protein TssA n=1 Tax=Enterobacter bugandensis TaxID=881260 RepID=UPI0026661900|nr:type VI secretion system protein TssA [Enterobacter bugandensis]MDO2431729.1 type VI secretion system protein TssA [Enterobacter bugandensis]MDO2444811.1 type VI secretion system protein TssA [Enterobacter bugandensis]